MDSQDQRQSGSLGDVPPGALEERQAPPSLREGVMRRVSQLDPYLAADGPALPLVDAVRDSRWEARAVAISTLVASAGDDALAAHRAALADEHPAVRAAAARAATRLRARAPLDRLALALRDADADVRLGAVEALGDLGAEHAQPVRPLLALALQDAHEAVRAEARLALERCDAATASAPVIAADEISPTRIQWASARHVWQVLRAQPTILQRGWLPVACLLLLCDVAVLLAALGLGTSLHDTSNILALVTTLAAAVGTAFVANLRYDPGLELAASTPTSMRTLLFCRFVLVVGSTLALSGGASVGVATVYGQGLWGVVQLWLGPALLVSSLTLALALLVGSWPSILLTSALEAVQALRFAPDHQIFFRDHALLVQTTPLAIGLALACLAFAFLYVPRQRALAPSLGDLC